MQEHQRYRDHQALGRRHQCLGDAVGHELRIARAEQGYGLERFDHADDGAEQSHQRRDAGNYFQYRLEALQFRRLTHDGLVEFGLERFGTCIQVGLVNRVNSAERIINRWR